MGGAERALESIRDGQVVGLGTGRAADAFVRALARRVAGGLEVRGVPTSRATARLAGGLGIPLASLDEVERIDVAVDGADEVDPRANLIKGYGGALVREKVVAAASERLVILVGPEKRVPKLGGRGRLPVAVLPFAVAPCRRALAALDCPPERRMRDGEPFADDDGNAILDCRVSPIDDPASLDAAIRAIPGVVGTGLFLGMADVVYVDGPEGVEVIEAKLG